MGRASSSKETSTGVGVIEEAQDFSMPNKNKQPQQTKSKLDDMLSKLMQKKNCVSIFLVIILGVSNNSELLEKRKFIM